MATDHAESKRTTLSVIAIDYSIKQTSSRLKKPLIHIFGRTHDGTLTQVEVHGFSPYFFALESEATAARDESCVRDIEFGHQTVTGESVVKVSTNTPRDVRTIRDNYTHYEADIPFTNRFLIDKNISSGISVPDDGDSDIIRVNESDVTPVDCSITPRIQYLDIEVDDRHGFPAADDASQPIICLCTYDSFDESYTVWFNKAGRDDDIPDHIDYEPIGEEIEYEIREYQSEEEMLVSYITYLNNTDPGVLTGWNFVDFDATYLVNRLENLNPDSDFELNPDRLSRVDEVWQNDWYGPTIKGRVVFDLLEAYKRYHFSEKSSYRLGDVGQRELSVPKEHYPGDIGELWETDPDRLIAYNLRDVELTVHIDSNDGIIPFWNETRAFVGCQLSDAPIPGSAVDMFVLQTLSDTYVLPSKGTNQSQADTDFEGGDVLEPINGLVDYVGVLDLKSLYPMVMHTINASPETKVPPDYEGESYRAPNGIHFRKDTDGVIRTMVDSLLEEREQKKSLRSQHEPGTAEYEQFDRQQNSIKVIMNALFGIFGWERFRLYDAEMSEAVTASGRAIIQYTADIAKSLGEDVIYGDTDSVLVALDVTPDSLSGTIPPSLRSHYPSLYDTDGFETPPPLREAYTEYPDVDAKMITAKLSRLYQLENQINDKYDEFAKEEFNAESHRFALEAETLYRRFLQAGKKKRYAGLTVWADGDATISVDITGFEYQRSNSAPVTKDVQGEVIERLVRGGSKSEIKSYLSDVIYRYRNGEIGIDEIAIPEGIRQELDNYDSKSSHQRGAQYANALFDSNFGKGSKPKRVALQRIDSQFWERIESEQDISPGGDSKADAIYAEFKRKQDVICFTHVDDIPPEFEPDWETMLEKTLQKPISRVLRAVDMEWDAVAEGKRQSDLHRFM